MPIPSGVYCIGFNDLLRYAFHPFATIQPFKQIPTNKLAEWNFRQMINSIISIIILSSPGLTI